jgi:hypothetical protein
MAGEDEVVTAATARRALDDACEELDDADGGLRVLGVLPVSQVFFLVPGFVPAPRSFAAVGFRSIVGAF